ncbi:MAG: Ig-like domain-containing protein [Dysgonamonadaceae bacterium]|jgi:hypothetical protein|nr:Ig-like domain-containing protein [Dysgonamonadaceae bacterium]
MKKRTTLFIALLAMIFSTKAQVTTPANDAVSVPVDVEVSVTLDNPVAILQVDNSISMPEQELDKHLFAEVNLPGDEQSSVDGWLLNGLWDNVYSESWPIAGGFHTGLDTDKWPQWITIDLGKTISLTKFRYWQRVSWDMIFTDRNVKKMEIWGSTSPNPDGSWDDSWTLLNTITSGTTSIGTDPALGQSGEEFAFPLDVLPVRYIRLRIIETWDGSTGSWFMMEIALTGSVPAINGVAIKDAANTPVTGVVATANGNKITIAHDAFEKNTTYTVTIPATSIQGLSEDITWSFKTAGADIEMLAASPADGDTNVATNAIINVTMNKPIDVLQTTSLPDDVLDKDLFANGNLPGDESAAYDWELPLLWDGVASVIFGDSPRGFHTESTNWPQHITIDLGQTAKLTKFRYWQRLEDFWDPGNNLYGFDKRNVKRMEIYGSNDPNPDGSWGNWQLLTTAVSGTTSIGEDRDLISEGEEFAIPSEAVPVRYIRLKILETWDGSTGAWFMMEVTFWGTPATVADVTIKDAANNPVTGVVATANGNKITINHDAFAANTTYNVNIPKESIKGLEEDITWSFTTTPFSKINNADIAGIKIMPTISRGTIVVEAPLSAKITVVNAVGKKLDTYSSTGNTSISLDYPDGLYFIVIQKDSSIVTRKVILKK